MLLEETADWTIWIPLRSSAFEQNDLHVGLYKILCSYHIVIKIVVVVVEGCMTGITPFLFSKHILLNDFHFNLSAEHLLGNSRGLSPLPTRLPLILSRFKKRRRLSLYWSECPE